MNSLSRRTIALLLSWAVPASSNTPPPPAPARPVAESVPVSVARPLAAAPVEPVAPVAVPAQAAPVPVPPEPETPAAKAPVVTILQPAVGDVTNGTGLEVSGTIAAETVLGSVVVRVGEETVPATFEAEAASSWRFTATGVPVGKGAKAEIVVEATDSMGLSGSSSVTLGVDRTPPTLTIEKPAAGAVVKAPFEVAGRVADDALGMVYVGEEPASVKDGRFSVTVMGGGDAASWRTTVRATPPRRRWTSPSTRRRRS